MTSDTTDPAANAVLADSPPVEFETIHQPAMAGSETTTPVITKLGADPSEVGVSWRGWGDDCLVDTTVEH